VSHSNKQTATTHPTLSPSNEHNLNNPDISKRHPKSVSSNPTANMWGYTALLPVFSSLTWLGMLLGMLIYWCTSGRPHYPSMSSDQTIAYISDVGAFRLKPLFIAGAAVSVVTLDLSLFAERWLRHNGRLAPNTSQFQKTISVLSIIFAVVGAAGIILLTIFDTYHHDKLHDGMLLLFIAGYIISAILIVTEYQRLGIHYRHHRILRISFWFKLFFIVVECILAIIFASTFSGSHQNVAAVVEWSIAFIFTFWIGSFIIDLLPSVQNSRHVPQGIREAEKRLEEGPNYLATNGSGVPARKKRGFGKFRF
jgi:Frag1/DRAM/Sfk1 family